jgi:protein SCO1/2
MFRPVRSLRQRRPCGSAGAFSFLVALLAVGAPAAGQTLLPPDPAVSVGNVIPFDGFVDENGRAFAPVTTAANAVGDARAWIVSPIYTRCPFTCTPITSALRAALGRSGLHGSEYRVVSFSFDPNETGEGLQAFRARMQLPAAWFTLRAKDSVSLERTLKALDFRTITMENGEFAHPNLIAFLAPDRRLVKYLFGTTFPPAEVAAAVQRARSGAAFAEPWETYLFPLAALGLLVSSLVFFSLLSRRRRLRQPRHDAVLSR